MAVGGKPEPERILSGGRAELGSCALDLAIFLNVCLAGVDIRAEFLRLEDEPSAAERGFVKASPNEFSGVTTLVGIV
jgi:hypothetical protein